MAAENEYARLHAQEGRHWWLRTRRRLVEVLLRDLVGLAPADRRRLLDVGCGAGGGLDVLALFGTAIGVDLAGDAVRLSRSHAPGRVVQADAARPPFAGASIDVVTCLDVLEHLRDDRAALAEIRRVCAPGGVVILTVPAYPFLWSAHDVALGHERRYRRGDLFGKVASSGLQILRLSHFFMGPFPAAAALRLLRKLALAGPSAPHSDLHPVPPLLNRLLGVWMRLETRALMRADLPFGLSLVCVARRFG